MSDTELEERTEGHFTEKCWKFMRYYASGRTAGQVKASAVRAGYSERSAKTTGFQLLQDPRVRIAVDKIRDDSGKARGVTEEWLKSRLFEVASADLPALSLPEGATARDMKEIMGAYAKIVDSRDRALAHLKDLVAVTKTDRLKIKARKDEADAMRHVADRAPVAILMPMPMSQADLEAMSRMQVQISLRPDPLLAAVPEAEYTILPHDK